MKVQEAQRVTNKMDAKSPTPGYIIIKMPNVKDKERILKAAREKQESYHKTVRRFLKRNTAGQKGLARNIQSHKKQGPTVKVALPSKAITQNRRADKELPRQEKTKGVHHHQAII